MLVMMIILPNFVVFEGGDGSGTTTQLGKLKERFAANAEFSLPRLFDTFEPSSGPIGRLIRHGLNGEIPMKNETIAFLFAADRNEHLYGPDGIVEHCKRGDLVACDRYLLSSLVYQGITCGEELPALLNRDFPLPELCFFLDIDPLIAQNRIKNRTQKEIYETLDFQIQVRERYKNELAKLDKASLVEIIDASLPPDEVAAQVWSALQKLPIFKG